MPFQFTSEEYANMIYVYGFCDGNGKAAEREYRRRFRNRRTPNHTIFSEVYQFSKEHGQFPSRAKHEYVSIDIQQREEVLQIVYMNPTVNVRKISHRLQIPRTRVWRTLKKFCKVIYTKLPLLLIFFLCPPCICH